MSELDKSVEGAAYLQRVLVRVREQLAAGGTRDEFHACVGAMAVLVRLKVLVVGETSAEQVEMFERDLG